MANGEGREMSIRRQIASGTGVVQECAQNMPMIIRLQNKTGLVEG